MVIAQPHSAQRGIDHLVLPVRDLDQAAATYEALGFCVTPRAQHPFGTANRLVQLQGCFLELLEVDRPELIGGTKKQPTFAEFNRDFLVGGEGFSMLVLEGGEIDATHDAIGAAGLDPRPKFSFERDAVQPDGSVARIGFDMVIIDYPDSPKAGFFTCTQRRPDLFWKSDYQTHANGAQGIHIVTLQGPDPDDLSDFLARFTACEAVKRPSGHVIDTPRGRIEIRAGSAQPAFNRFVLTTSSLDAVRAHARAANIPCTERALGLEFGPEHMYGIAVRFVAARPASD